MKLLITLILLIGSFHKSSSQTLNEFEKPTPKHINISGTNIFLIPPLEFKLSEQFKGFQDPDDQTSMIIVMEIPGPFSEVSKGFTHEMLKSRGMTLHSKKEITVNNYQGYLIHLDQEANGLIFGKDILVYGNSQFTSMINGVYLKDSVQSGNKIRESILSTVIDRSLEVDPRQSLDYTLNENIGDLKFKSVIGNGMLFNRDLKTPTESSDKATLITDRSFAKAIIENKKMFCVSRLKKYPQDYSVITEKGINEIIIDGLSGFELFAKNNDTANEEMYQVILFQDDGGYFIFIGTYLSGSEKAQKDIMNIVKTFKRKP